MQNYTKTLQPYLSYATVNNSSNQYLLYLQNNWNTNGTVGNDVECFGSAVVNTSMTCLSQGYGYDNLNRLTSAGENYYQNPSSGAGYSRNFSYDEYGNMSVSASSNVPTSGLMPQTSQSPFNTANNQLKTATYADPRGNMTLVAAGSVSMSYDGESRQTKTVDPGTGVTMNYLYDGAGQRVQKQSSNGTTTVDVHDVFGQLVAEYSSVGVTPACTTCYLTYDGLGSVRLVTDQNAGIVTRHDYLPYGEEIPNGSAGRCCNNFGNTANVTQMFTGQERDGGTADLDYFNARHMSNILGRFTQPDPGGAGADVTNPQTWNAYAYVGGNPLGMTDPSGMVGLSTYSPTDGLNCYSAERQDPCDGDVDGGGFFGKLPIHYGGGRPSGGAAGTATGATGTSGPAVGSPGTAPPSSGGETLGLPPHISVPLPGLASITGVGTGCEFGACGQMDFQLGMSAAAAQAAAQADFINYLLLANALKRAGSHICGSAQHTGDYVYKGVRNGAISGSIRGALNGAGIRSIPFLIPNIMGATELGGEAGAVGGPIGIAVGAIAGGAVGAGGGVVLGFVKSAACKAAGF